MHAREKQPLTHSFTGYLPLTGSFFSPFAIQAQALFLSYVGLWPCLWLWWVPSTIAQHTALSAKHVFLRNTDCMAVLALFIHFYRETEDKTWLKYYFLCCLNEIFCSNAGTLKWHSLLLPFPEITASFF